MSIKPIFRNRFGRPRGDSYATAVSAISSGVRSIWETVAERVQALNPTPKNYFERCANDQYISTGQLVEARNHQALGASPRMPITYPSLDTRYFVTTDLEIPSESNGAEEYRAILKELGFPIDQISKFCYVISRGAPLNDKNKPDPTYALLVMVIPPDESTIIITDIDRNQDSDFIDENGNLVPPMPLSELIHQVWTKEVGSPQDFKHFITYPIFQAGTQAVIEDCFKSKNLHIEDMATILPSDRGYPGLLGNAWHAVLGTKNVRYIPHMLADHPDVYGKKVTKIFLWAKIPGETLNHGIIIIEVGEESAY